MASAGCRYEVDLYIFLKIMLAVFLLHTEKISTWRYFLITTCITDQTDWKTLIMSQIQFYKIFYFFSGISDHDSVKLCYSRTHFVFIRSWGGSAVDGFGLVKGSDGF